MLGHRAEHTDTGQRHRPSCARQKLLVVVAPPAGQDPRLPPGSSASGLVPSVGFFKVEGASLVTQVRNQEEHPK